MRGKFGKKKSTAATVDFSKEDNISLNNGSAEGVSSTTITNYDNSNMINVTPSLPSLSIPTVNFSSEVTDKVIKSLKKLELPHLKELVEGSGIDPEVLRVNKIMSLVTLPGA